MSPATLLHTPQFMLSKGIEQFMYSKNETILLYTYIHICVCMYMCMYDKKYTICFL